MASQLTLYNGALRILGEGPLASLTEDREARYILDDIWDDGARDHCLQEGLWNFAIRTRQASYDTDVTPGFGHRYAFSKPTDWIRTAAIASDEYFRCPLTDLDCKDENGYWWADLQTIYIKHVSNDSAYGYDLSLWPQTFVKFFEGYLAMHLSPRLRQSGGKRKEAIEVYKEFKREALNKDAMNQGAMFPPEGAWAGSRRGGRLRRDRGSRGRLIG